LAVGAKAAAFAAALALLMMDDLPHNARCNSSWNELDRLNLTHYTLGTAEKPFPVPETFVNVEARRDCRGVPLLLQRKAHVL
jgi:hypothetical protein